MPSASAFLEGFFSGAGQRLIYDDALRGAVDRWLSGIEEESFIAHLPLLRRVFSSLDGMERRRLVQAVLGGAGRLLAILVPAPDGGECWRQHLTALVPWLVGAPANG